MGHHDLPVPHAPASISSVSFFLSRTSAPARIPATTNARHDTHLPPRRSGNRSTSTSNTPALGVQSRHSARPPTSQALGSTSTSMSTSTINNSSSSSTSSCSRTNAWPFLSLLSPLLANRLRASVQPSQAQALAQEQEQRAPISRPIAASGCPHPHHAPTQPERSSEPSLRRSPLAHDQLLPSLAQPASQPAIFRTYALAMVMTMTMTITMTSQVPPPTTPPTPPRPPPGPASPIERGSTSGRDRPVRRQSRSAAAAPRHAMPCRAEGRQAGRAEEVGWACGWLMARVEEGGGRGGACLPCLALLAWPGLALARLLDCLIACLGAWPCRPACGHARLRPYPSIAILAPPSPSLSPSPRLSGACVWS
ncbi:uncharacterized protein K452DRAFT_344241 [Aplosporella prunicola CBS 121167]|uniref:Uncharacterized protein n=1 Tax=Aplosporella prunicola CBS 121167 TaxID=1176127 RepID=A0A6A6AYZ2_9PEZI|nr:uncharacterized protein K452DRAFT_344241 [Aplosporella prunicola CBS 121167]KAF2136224.1 hypothetical protein K452DRAFT_344241 [Aplosporella prunicola CBS 121167]